MGIRVEVDERPAPREPARYRIGFTVSGVVIALISHLLTVADENRRPSTAGPFPVMTIRSANVDAIILDWFTSDVTTMFGTVLVPAGTGSRYAYTVPAAAMFADTKFAVAFPGSTCRSAPTAGAMRMSSSGPRASAGRVRNSTVTRVPIGSAPAGIVSTVVPSSVTRVVSTAPIVTLACGTARTATVIAPLTDGTAVDRAVTVVVPAPMAVTTPVPETVATVGALLLQLTAEETPASAVTTALASAASPTMRSTRSGSTRIWRTVGAAPMGPTGGAGAIASVPPPPHATPAKASSVIKDRRSRICAAVQVAR